MYTIEQVKTWIAELPGIPPAGQGATMTCSSEIVFYGRETDGRLYIRREFYVPESYSDDDDSCTGFVLAHREGSTRRAVQVHATELEPLLGRALHLGFQKTS